MNDQGFIKALFPVDGFIELRAIASGKGSIGRDFIPTSETSRIDQFIEKYKQIDNDERQGNNRKCAGRYGISEWKHKF